MALTARQQRFVDEYLVDLNATQAAIRAGYSPPRAHITGSELVANRKVAEVIAERKRRVTTKLEITAEKIAQEAWSIASDAEHPAAARVSALTLLAKRHPEFSEKHDVSVHGRIEALQAVAQLTADELKELAQRARA